MGLLTQKPLTPEFAERFFDPPPDNQDPEQQKLHETVKRAHKQFPALLKLSQAVKRAIGSGDQGKAKQQLMVYCESSIRHGLFNLFI